MGNPVAEGLSPNVPDKTPAKISSRILEHMLKSVARIYRQDEIKDAVITVPASFDSIMCQATLNAAELAGIQIRNADGSLRSILLPEPQAVIYDFMNQVRNSEISDKILDLNAPKNVMVFDLGGGTLDITLHKISRRNNNAEILNIEDLAINRYTLLGGDDFDLALAKNMFARYLEQFRTRPEIVNKIKREENAVMPQLLNQTEELKIRVSMDHSEEFGNMNAFDNAWGDEADNYAVGGAIGATGYAYDDNFTTQELEKIWRVFMGEEIKIVALDTDQSVARGAAVYHYYLHKYAENIQAVHLSNTAAKVTAPPPTKSVFQSLAATMITVTQSLAKVILFFPKIFFFTAGKFCGVYGFNECTAYYYDERQNL